MVPMARQVKIPGDAEILGMDDIDRYTQSDDEFSQGEETTGSQDVSDYEGNPRAAPARIYIGPDCCRKEFQV